jgi:hypothetical protein
MSGDIFLLRGGDDLVPMTEAPYDSEDVLQELLAKFPDLLAGDQLAGTDARRWVLWACLSSRTMEGWKGYDQLIDGMDDE